MVEIKSQILSNSWTYGRRINQLQFKFEYIIKVQLDNCDDWTKMKYYEFWLKSCDNKSSECKIKTWSMNLKLIINRLKISFISTSILFDICSIYTKFFIPFFHFFYNLFLKFLFEFSSVEKRYFLYNHSFSRDMNEI